MKEQLYTIPLNEAMNAQDECPFCFIERSVEQDLLDFVLGSGSSYMESDIREATDNSGFCRPHFKKMFDYGNALGNAWILKTHYKKMIQELSKEFSTFSKGNLSSNKTTLKDRLLKNTQNLNSIGVWITNKEDSCYVCQQYRDTFNRYLDTFFYLLKQDSDFKKKVIESKGFCLPHFKDLCEGADNKLTDKERKEFYEFALPLMEENFRRLEEDVAWMVEKFDYRNKDADWRSSKDAIQRGMQKLKGGYPADPVYRSSK